MIVERFKRIHDPAFEHWTFTDRVHVMVSESEHNDGRVNWQCWVIDEDGGAIDSDKGIAADRESARIEGQRRALLMACKNGIYG
jgi:hypothetical protein